MWAIEGDISKCFDRFDHKALVSIIRKKYITQQVFIFINKVIIQLQEHKFI